MDHFRYFMPTEVFFGRGIVKEKKELFRQLGSRAYIITYQIPGRHYALEDVTQVLDELQIPYFVATLFRIRLHRPHHTAAAGRIKFPCWVYNIQMLF